jgi:hypothetical protein
MKLEFSRQIFQRYSNTKFHENPSSRSRVVLCGQTDGHDEAHSRYSQFCYRASKRNAKSMVADTFLEWFCCLMPGEMDLNNVTRTKTYFHGNGSSDVQPASALTGTLFEIHIDQFHVSYYTVTRSTSFAILAVLPPVTQSSFHRSYPSKGVTNVQFTLVLHIVHYSVATSRGEQFWTWPDGD